MAWVLIVAGKAFPRAAAVATSSLPPIGWLPRMAAFLRFHVAKLMACPLGSWGVMYAKYDIYASAPNRVYRTPWKGDPRVNIQNAKGMSKAYQVKQVLQAVERLEVQNSKKY